MNNSKDRIVVKNFTIIPKLEAEAEAEFDKKLSIKVFDCLYILVVLFINGLFIKQIFY